jgi:hypothetical protein
MALIVLEPGSDWPGEPAGEFDGVIALANDEATLLERTRDRLAELVRRSDRLGTAVLACCAAAQDVVARRMTLARLLFDALEAAGNGRLVLCAGPDAPPSLRDELYALAASMGSAGGTPVSVAAPLQPSR